jgi:thiamine biosynthesis lipoprotein
MTTLHSFPFDALGTECILHLYADSAVAADAAAAAAIDEVDRIESRYSRYRPDSTLSAINHAAQCGNDIAVDAETAALLDYAFACHRMSDGLFDITSGVLRQAWDFASGRLPAAADVAALLPRIGMDKLDWHPPQLGFHDAGIELDFGGIGKEYAADRAAEVCYAAGIAHGLIDLGGDIRVLGPHADGSPWRIGIRDPQAPAQAVAIVELAGGALATSGDYERYLEVDGRRYCHILDPHTGWPVRGLRSASIHAERCLLAGSLATVAMLKGASAQDWLAGLGVAHLWVDATGRQGGTLPAREPA